MTSRLIEDLIERYMERWNDCASIPETTLLRLAVLHSLIQNLHSEKSKCLAKGLKAEAQVIKSFEQKIQLLRELPLLQGDLMAVINGAGDEQRKKKRLLPEALFQSIEREKLNRHDRLWESAMCAEAATLAWTLWYLETWVKISTIEEWDITLGQKLWPHGLVLFTENAQSKEAPHSFATATDSTAEEPVLWHGRWFLILHPQFQSPTDLSLNLNLWPGYPTTPPSPPYWKLLFP